MSFSITYKPLFTINIEHEIFGKDYSKKVLLEPSNATQQLMKNGRMVFRRVSDGFRVLYQANAVSDPLIELEANQTFTFSLQIKEKTAFANLTKLKLTARDFLSTDLLFFENKPSNATNLDLDYKIIEKIEREYIDEKSTGYFKVKIHNSDSSIINDLLAERLVRPVNMGIIKIHFGATTKIYSEVEGFIFNIKFIKAPL